MSQISIRGENGEIVAKKQFNRGVAFLGDYEVFQPAVVERFEYDSEFGMSETTKVNGKSEARVESDKLASVVIEGIVSEDQKRLLKNLQQQRQLSLVSDIYSGSIVVKRVVIEQNTDIIHISVDDQQGKQLAFEFQLQLEVPAKHGDPTTSEEQNAEPAEVIGTAPILYNREYDRSGGTYDPS